MQLGVTVGDYKKIIEKNKANLRIFTFLDKKEKVYIMYVLNRELKSMDRRMKIIKISTRNFKEKIDYLINAKVLKRNDLQSPNPNVYFRFDLPTWGADRSDRSVGKEPGILSLIELLHVETKKTITQWHSYCKISYKEGVLMLDEPFIEDKLKKKMVKIFSGGINIKHD